ncbi:MAG: hypothetical protein AAF621_04860 [Pseudomonadota bacterium]
MDTVGLTPLVRSATPVGASTSSNTASDQKREAEAVRADKFKGQNEAEVNSVEKQAQAKSNTKTEERIAKLEDKAVEKANQKALEGKEKVAETAEKGKENLAVARFEAKAQSLKDNAAQKEDQVALQASRDDEARFIEVKQQRSIEVAVQQENNLIAQSIYGGETKAAVKTEKPAELSSTRQSAEIDLRTGEPKVQKFVAPVPITEIRAPTVPSDHIHLLKKTTEEAFNAITSTESDGTKSNIITVQNGEANRPPEISASSPVNTPANTPEGTISNINPEFSDLDYGLAS